MAENYTVCTIASLERAGFVSVKSHLAELNPVRRIGSRASCPITLLLVTNSSFIPPTRIGAGLLRLSSNFRG